MIEEKPPLNELAHYGVKGMHWGQRKGSTPGVPVKIDKAARKDAEEFTRAKLFYGQGAGTRRKLIKAKVETAKKDPMYAKAFDHHVSNTNLAKRADQAKSERKRKDTTASVKKTARGVGHILRGNSQYANTAAAVAVAAGVHAHNTGADKVIADALKKKMSDITR